MNLNKEQRLMQLATSSKRISEKKLKDEMVEILISDIEPIKLIEELALSKMQWSKVPLHPKVKQSRFSISKALNNL